MVVSGPQTEHVMDQRIIQILSDSFTQLLIPGICVTIPLTLISFAIGLVVAVAIALIRTAKTPVLEPTSSNDRERPPVREPLARIYVWIFRGTPALVQLFVIFFGLPSIGIVIDAFPSAVIAFSLNVGAYASEALRAAISAVPKGQLEAGLCVGMSWTQTMFRIVLPQAFRTAFPPLFNEFISLVKNTSLASSITVYEMFMSAQRIAARTYEPFWLYLEAAVIYLAFTTILSRIQVWGEKKLQHYDY